MKFMDPRHSIINKAGYTKFIPQIADNISPYAAMFLAELLNSDSYWLKNYKKKTGKNYTGIFFHNRSEIKKRTGLSPTFQRKAQKELDELNIISVETKGLPRRNYFTINYEALDAFLLHHMNSKTNDQEEELIEVDEGNSQPLTTSTSSRQPGERLEIAQDDDILNKNKGIRINNKNKVSKATYVPDGTESTDFASELDTSGIKDLKNSCIKEKSGTKAPPRIKPSSTGDEIQDIVNEYNAAMGLTLANGDYNAVQEKLEDFRTIRKFFTPSGLAYAWRNFGDKTASKLEKKRVSALVSYKVLEPFVRRRNEIYTYMADYWDNKLDKVFKHYCEMLNEITPENYTINRYGELEIDGYYASTAKAHRKNRIEVYKQYLEPRLLPEEDIYDMIIDMEAPEWII